MGKESDTRERLIRAAMNLFHARGYNAVGVNEICEAANVKKGSLYHFFAGKRDLALAAIDAQWEFFRDELLEPAFATDLPPLERIRRFFIMTCAYHDSARNENGQIKGCPFGNLAMELSANDEGLRVELEKIFGRIGGYLEKALAEYSPGHDARTGAEQLLAYHQGTVLLAKTHNDQQLIEAMAGSAVELARLTATATT